MDLLEDLFKILIALFGLVLTTLKIIDLYNKSSDRILKDLQILEKTNELRLKNDTIKENIEKKISEKYPKTNIPVKRNWWIIIICFLLSCILSYHLFSIDADSEQYEVTIWIYIELFLFMIFFTTFVTAIFNIQINSNDQE